MTRFRDYDKNGIIGHSKGTLGNSNGVAYKAVKKNDRYSFEQEGVTFKATFDSNGNFKGYKGSDGSTFIGEVTIREQLSKIVGGAHTFNDIIGNSTFLVDVRVQLRATQSLKTKVSWLTYGLKVPEKSQDFRILRAFGKNTKYVKVFGYVKIAGGVKAFEAPLITGYVMIYKA